MILTLQFPLADLRSFLESSSRLSKPSWPLAEKDKQFVRFFGCIRARTTGGLPKWAGENENVLCIADNALIFDKNLSLYNKKLGLNLILRRAFTNFYFDGTAVGKFEIAVANKTGDKVDLTQMQFRAVVNHFVKLPVRVRHPLGQSNKQELAQAGPAIAQLYFIASTERWQKDIDKVLDNFVCLGAPLLYLQYEQEDEIDIPQTAKLIPLPEEYGFTLYRYVLPYEGRRIYTWVVCYSSKTDHDKARTLRLYLSRLHAEYECLRIVLRSILDRQINPAPQSEVSDRLQYYLNKATRNIIHLKHSYETQFSSEPSYIVRDIISRIRPGELEELLGIVNDLKLRGNITRKTEEFIREEGKIGSPNINIFYSDHRVNTEGGTYVAGNVAIHSGNFTGRDQIIKDYNSNGSRNVDKLEENDPHLVVSSKIEEESQKILLRDLGDPQSVQSQNEELGSDQEHKAPENLPTIKSITQPSQSSIAFDWVHVEAGEFVMGLDRAGHTDATDWEMPRTHLFLPEFWMTRTPVTVAQFTHFVQATGYKTTAEATEKSYVSTGTKFQWLPKASWQHPFGPAHNMQQKGDHPVTCVSWYDAVVFCQWAGLRLPSEAEWEKAARGKTGSLYPWGNSDPNRGLCNFNANARDTLPVGSFPDGVSPYQVLDMAGNVWEWTCSLWGMETSTPQFRYPYRQDDGRENLQAPASFLRVMRGGSWDSRAAAVRTTFRGRFDPTWPCNHIGFRVVWSPAS